MASPARMYAYADSEIQCYCMWASRPTSSMLTTSKRTHSQSCQLGFPSDPSCRHIPPGQRSSSNLSLCHSVNTTCPLIVLMESDNNDGAAMRKGGTKSLRNCEFRSEDRKCSLSLGSSTLHTRARTHTHTQKHTREHSVPTLSHCDTDGGNMRDVSAVAGERYLWPRWEPNAVNCTSCLPNHFSQREMVGQDKLVIWQKTIHLERGCAVCKGKPPFSSPDWRNGSKMGLADLDVGERGTTHPSFPPNSCYSFCAHKCTVDEIILGCCLRYTDFSTHGLLILISLPGVIFFPPRSSVQLICWLCTEHCISLLPMCVYSTYTNTVDLL